MQSLFCFLTQDGQSPDHHTSAPLNGGSSSQSPRGLGPQPEGAGAGIGSVQGSPAGSGEQTDAEEEFTEAMRQVRGPRLRKPPQHS